MKAYALEHQEVLKALEVDPEKGLSDEQVTLSRQNQGSNQIGGLKKKGLMRKLIENIKEPMIGILLLAAGLTMAINIIKYIRGDETEFIECIGIIGAIVLTVMITLIMEGKSEKAFEMINQMKESTSVRLIRNGAVHLVNQSEVVVGDIYLVAAGDKLVADGRIIEANDLQVDESLLTGESEIVNKNALKCAKDTAVAERKNMLYSGSFVVAGNAKIVVTKVGEQTEFGRIAKALQISTEMKTPLQEKLANLSGKIALLGILIAGITFMLQLLQMHGKYTFEGVLSVFLTSVVLIVAAVPEGLSTIVTAALAMNVMKLAKEKTLVKKMVACDTIGSVNIICSDKTGTLTENKMKLVKLEPREGEEKQGEIYLWKNICLNSTADIEVNQLGEIHFIGNPTECALLEGGYERNIHYKVERGKYKKLYTRPFSSEQKKMTTIVQKIGESNHGPEEYIILTKGSPEIILSQCNMEEQTKCAIYKAMASYQEKACRIIAFCHYVSHEVLDDKEVEQLIEAYQAQMVYDGFAVIADPLRKEVFEAIRKCKEARRTGKDDDFIYLIYNLSSL